MDHQQYLGADARELTTRALHGDEEALGRLLELHQEWAYNLAYRVLGHDADARDAVQDAFLQTVRSLRGDGAPPRTTDSFRPWLRRVVSNAAVTQIRRRHGVHPVSVEAVAESLAGPSAIEPGHAVEQAETRAQVLQVLLGLPETQRVALALREYLDASYDEIAEALDLPRTAIGTLLFRARASFRGSFDRVTETAPPADCPDLVPLFSSIIDGEARPDAWADLEAHLRACDRCGGELASQRRARRAYALLPSLALPAGWEPARMALASAATTATAAATGLATGAPTRVASAAAPPAVPLPVDPVGAAVAASAHAAGPVASGVAGAGVGLVGAVSGAKLTLAALVTAAVVGVGVVAAPFVAPTEPTPEPTAQTAALPSPSPAAALVGSPVSSPMASPDAVSSPGVPSPPPAASPSPSPSPGSAGVTVSPIIPSVNTVSPITPRLVPTPSPVASPPPTPRP